jgi:hypothetical protein
LDQSVADSNSGHNQSYFATRYHASANAQGFAPGRTTAFGTCPSADKFGYDGHQTKCDGKAKITR